MKKLIYSILIVCVVVLFAFYFYKKQTNDNSENIIRVGYRSGNMNYGPFYVAEGKGYFDKKNIIIKHVPLASANDIKLAISMGQIDVAIGAANVFLVPISKGVSIRMVSPMAVGPMHLIVRDPNIKTFKDLEGKSFATSQGGPSESFVRYVLNKEGVDVNKIKFVYTDKAFRPSALMDKKIVDAVPVGEDELGKYAEIGAIPHEEWETKGYVLDGRLEEVLVVNDEFDTKNKVLMDNFIDAIVDGHRFIKNNPDEAADIVYGYIKDGGDVSSVQELIDIWSEGKLSYMLWCDKDIITQMSEIAFIIGQVESKLTLEQILNSRFENKLSKAQNEIYGTN